MADSKQNQINDPVSMDENDMAPDLISLVDEDGQEFMFEILDRYDEDDNHYLAVAPYYEDAEEMLEEDGELIILKSVEDETDGDPYLVPIEDETEFNRISAIFVKRLEEYYDIIDVSPSPER